MKSKNVYSRSMQINRMLAYGYGWGMKAHELELMFGIHRRMIWQRVRRYRGYLRRKARNVPYHIDTAHCYFGTAALPSENQL